MPAFVRPKLSARVLQLFVLAATVSLIYWFALPSISNRVYGSPAPPVLVEPPTGDDPLALDHPISRLIAAADKDLKALLRKQSDNVNDAAEAYRRRRGRQPPPGFDKWFEHAQNHDALVIEEFFDRIYEDLAPFWGVPAQQTREQAADYLFRISVRNGKVTNRDDGVERVKWLQIWSQMIESVAHMLPDMDIPVNEMDESRIIVPWKELEQYLLHHERSKRIVDEVETSWAQSGKAISELDETPPKSFDPAFHHEGPFWDLAVAACAPDSPAKKYTPEKNYKEPGPVVDSFPHESYHGFVRHWKIATSVCDNPLLQGTHGTFVEPVSIATSKKFFPLFGGSKLSVNNEILLPAPMYWTNDSRFSGGEQHGGAWSSKKDAVIWRGTASGGRNREDTWHRFQRHRFVAMMNSTFLPAAESTADHEATRKLDNMLAKPWHYDLAVSSPQTLADWIAPWSDVAMMSLNCFPGEEKGQCTYTAPYYQLADDTPMSKQYGYKYLPDIDGNSFSGRYRAFMASTSLVIKATIYQEWHDSRLIPWRHFVPMDNTFIDIYGIMEYFIGNSERGVKGHDDVAQEIALEGAEWAAKVLRKEDMSIYIHRLLLEYARVSSDQREWLGWREPAAVAVADDGT